MSNWKQRYRAYKQGLGLTNKDIAESLKLSLNSVEVMVNKKDGSFPKWAKLGIITYETMLKNGKISYNPVTLTNKSNSRKTFFCSENDGDNHNNICEKQCKLCKKLAVKLL